LSDRNPQSKTVKNAIKPQSCSKENNKQQTINKNPTKVSDEENQNKRTK
jgi:hypothetical protein